MSIYYLKYCAKHKLHTHIQQQMNKALHIQVSALKECGGDLNWASGGVNCCQHEYMFHVDTFYLFSMSILVLVWIS